MDIRNYIWKEIGKLGVIVACICVSLSAALFVSVADAFAWLTSQHSIVNDVEIGAIEQDESIYAAIYGSTRFVIGKGDEIPSSYMGSNLTMSFMNIGRDRYIRYNDVPWFRQRANIKSVDIVDTIRPSHIDYWFYEFTNCPTFTIDKLDTSRLISMSNSFCMSRIDDRAFACARNWDISRCTDLSSAFRSTRLSSLEPIETWDVGNVTSVNSCFSSCPNISTVDISNWNVSSCEDFSGLFAHCNALKNIGDLSNWDMSSARTLDNMFRETYDLTSIGDCSGWNTSKIESMIGTFQECNSLVGLEFVSQWKVDKCEQFSSMLRGCSQLERLDLSGWNVKNAKSLGYTFADCVNLKELNSYGWRLDSIEDMHQTFGNCYNLCEIIGIDDWNVGKTLQSLWKTWSGCSNLKWLDLSSWNVIQDLYATDALEGCTSLEEITIPSTFSIQGNRFFPTPNLKIISTSDGLWYANGTGIGLSPDQASAMMNEAYGNDSAPIEWSLNSDSKAYFSLYGNDSEGCCLVVGRGTPSDSYNNMPLLRTFLGIEGGVTDFTDGNIPWNDSMNNIVEVVSLDVDLPIRTTTLKSFFEGAGNLRSADLHVLDTINVTDMSVMFAGCQSLVHLNVSGFDTSNVSHMNYMFKDCSSIQELNLNCFETSNVEVFESMFERCSSLVNLDISNWSLSSAESIASMFSGCCGLQSLSLPSRFVNSNIKSISMAFNECSVIESIDASDWNMNNVENYSYAFNSCRHLREVVGMEDWDTSRATNMTQMFGMCPELIANLSNWNIDNVTIWTGFNAGSPEIISPFVKSQMLDTIDNSESPMLEIELSSSSVPSIDTPEGSDSNEINTVDNTIPSQEGIQAEIVLSCDIPTAQTLNEDMNHHRPYRSDIEETLCLTS